MLERKAHDRREWRAMEETLLSVPNVEELERDR